jgi:hypothetical protein
VLELGRLKGRRRRAVSREELVRGCFVFGDDREFSESPWDL